MKKRTRTLSFELGTEDLRRVLSENRGIVVRMVVTHANIRLVAKSGERKIDIRPVQTATDT